MCWFAVSARNIVNFLQFAQSIWHGYAVCTARFFPQWCACRQPCLCVCVTRIVHINCHYCRFICLLLLLVGWKKSVRQISDESNGGDDVVSSRVEMSTTMLKTRRRQKTKSFLLLPKQSAALLADDSDSHRTNKPTQTHRQSKVKLSNSKMHVNAMLINWRRYTIDVWWRCIRDCIVYFVFMPRTCTQNIILLTYWVISFTFIGNSQ